MLLVCGCGGKGSGGNPDSVDPPRLWDRQLVAEHASQPGIAVAGDGTVDIVYLGSVNAEFGVVWQTVGGTPHVAFVDEDTGNGMAYHAVHDTGGWQIVPVNGTNWFGDSEVGIALTADELPVVGAPNSDGEGVWVAESDAGSTWTVTDLAPERISAGPVDVAVGSAGLAVGFKDERYTIVAWRAAGSSEWSIEEASHHDLHQQFWLPAQRRRRTLRRPHRKPRGPATVPRRTVVADLQRRGPPRPQRRLRPPLPAVQITRPPGRR